MLDFVFEKSLSATTIINYLALTAFIIETVGIIILKMTGMNSFSEWKYLDFFLKRNVYIILLLRIAILVASLAIFLPEMFSTYRLLSVIYFTYLLIFYASCGWMYAHFKGYTKESTPDDQRN